MYPILHQFIIQHWKTAFAVTVCFVCISFGADILARYHGMRYVAVLDFLIYLGVLYTVTIGSRTVQMASPKCHLFWTYRQIFGYRDYRYLVENLFNILLFIPMGALLKDRLWMTHQWYGMAVFGGLFSFGIEILQFLTHRGCFDVDDIFHNVLGAVLGFGIMGAVLKQMEM